ncbi:hypothetical protein MARPO_0010s0134 [Marchantia polymorpha]|uniref:Malectin-like domain-containing protein n=2 Tax=Marchantia polymorpha TaxID=3197 RepID=A0A2R6XKZ5_MARPO|nr:hypothetical protein MARPO_0010s0134 [Marchantia polymorpha]|eukprot:PTQ46751.1 hypothetical protein MARPO_0010s0134 [Marchantia polymorpha]
MEGSSRRRRSAILTALCTFFALALSSSAQEFLSIDCGADVGRTDEAGIKWVTDDGYVKTGRNREIRETGTAVQLGSPDFSLTSAFTYPTARVFTEKRSKHCYVLPVQKNSTYLLRTIQYAGESISTASIAFPVSFNVTVNNEVWYSFSGQTDDDLGPFFYESVFYSLQKEEVDVCFVAGALGTPFVNSIEMRKLNPLSYYEVQRGGVYRFLDFVGRYNTGQPSNSSYISYPDDPYDRYWMPITNILRAGVANSSVLATPTQADQTTAGWNFAPERVQEDAWVGTDLSVQFPRAEGAPRAYAAWYFQEIRNLTAAELLRNPTQMVVSLNGESHALNLSTFSPQQVSMLVELESSTTVDLNLISPNGSRPAILNAFELHWAYEVDQSTTNANDATVLKSLQSIFGLEDWQGDACYPVAWDWVACDGDSRIIELNLSDKNLTGPIPDAIVELTQLQKIRLDNNQLNGTIPQSLRTLRNLQLLALDNNNLSGDIPAAFVDKAGFTFSGNPGICQVGGNCNSTAPNPAPAEASKSDDDSNEKIYIGVIAALSVIIAVLVAGLVFCSVRGNRYKSRAAPVVT